MAEKPAGNTLDINCHSDLLKKIEAVIVEKIRAITPVLLVT